MYHHSPTNSYVSFTSVDIHYETIDISSIKDAIEYLTSKKNNPECNACYAKPTYLFVRVYNLEQVWFCNYCEVHELDAGCDYEDCVYIKFLFNDICANNDYDKILNSINVLRKSLLLV